MRTNTVITIVRVGVQRPNVNVPITPDSRRKWRLMEEDNITLSFNLADTVDFNIGDHITDEIFGRFVISEDPVPADFDPVTGAYKYTLRFDADWICWKNYLVMLTYGTGTQADPYIRRETEWVLTDTLEQHLEVIRQNLVAIGYSGYVFRVNENDVPGHLQAICISYSGTSILDALKTLAESYECEFWLTDELDDDDNPIRVVNFGKCETGTAIALSMTDEGNRVINVENMVPMRNESEYANRLYVYGSTKNIPETYRKKLVFSADDYVTGDVLMFRDSIRPLKSSMFQEKIVDRPMVVISYSGEWTMYDSTPRQVLCYYRTGVISVVEGNIIEIAVANQIIGARVYSIKNGKTDALLAEYHNPNYPADPDGWSYDNDSPSGGTLSIPSGVTSVGVEIETDGVQSSISFAFRMRLLKAKGYFAILTSESNGETALVRLETENYLVFVDTTQSLPYMYLSSPPISVFGEGSAYYLSISEDGSDGLLLANVPSAYYSEDNDDPNSIRLLGERRLMLPKDPSESEDEEVVAIADDIENGYVQRDHNLTRDKIVEKVVVFEEIYPRCALRITDVTEGEYDADTEYEDGSVKKATLPAYILQAERITPSGDVDFPFDPVTMVGIGQTLKITFLTPDETTKYSEIENESVCSLMGMTFEVECNRVNGVTTYEIAWNSDYGGKLPNEILKPKVRDAFILSGWNPAAMPSLGIVESAENELAKVADKYAELIEEAQFTFDCSMMSDWILGRCSQSAGRYLPDGLFPAGQKVVVHHGALASDKETRVIGFEYKLDIPYDTPVYTVGETEAYSRLKDIEKSLNAKPLNNTSASGSTSSSASGSKESSGSTKVNESLHLVYGSTSGIGVDYNGQEEKTARIPSRVEHLSDGVDLLGRVTTLENIKEFDNIVVSSLPTASASTTGHIYYVGPDSSGNYNRYITQESSGTYSWVPMGSTAIPLADYATKEDLDDIALYLDFKYGATLVASGTLTDQLIRSNGNIEPWNDFIIKVYSVSGGKAYKITGLETGNSYICGWAVYNGGAKLAYGASNTGESQVLCVCPPDADTLYVCQATYGNPPAITVTELTGRLEDLNSRLRAIEAESDGSEIGDLDIANYALLFDEIYENKVWYNGDYVDDPVEQRNSTPMVKIDKSKAIHPGTIGGVEAVFFDASKSYLTTVITYISEPIPASAIPSGAEYVLFNYYRDSLIADEFYVSTRDARFCPKLYATMNKKKGERPVINIYTSDSQEEIFQKLVDAWYIRDCDVFFEYGEYTFDTIFALMKTKYGWATAYELPIGGNCRYYFNGATLTGSVFSTDTDVQENSSVLGTHRVADASFELHDGTIIADGIGYCIHDEASGGEEPYLHKYENMVIRYLDGMYTNPTNSKCIGGGTGLNGMVVIEGCLFYNDNTTVDVSWHGHTESTASEFKVFIRDCYFDHTFGCHNLAANETATLLLSSCSMTTEPYGTRWTVKKTVNDFRSQS